MSEISENLSETTPLTSEADKLFKKYIGQLTKSYIEMGLTQTEITESIDELSLHILSLAKFYVGESNLITTDPIRKAITKLGEPSVIKLAFDEEMEFSQSLLKRLIQTKPIFEKQIIENTKEIQVKDVVKLYSLVSYLAIGSLIFQIFGYEFASYTASISYISLVLAWLGIKSQVPINQNLILQEKLGNVLFLVLFPFIYMAVFAFYSVTTLDLFLFNPVMIIMWLIVITQKDTKEYFTKLYEKIAKQRIQ